MHHQVQNMIVAVAMVALVGAVRGADEPAIQPRTVVADGTVVASNGARIVFDSLVLDFGKAAAGQVIEHNFVFTNIGNQTLEIKDVRPTCGCTVVGTWDRHVEPGKTGSIQARFTPDNRDEEVSKTVIVDCNDPLQTNVTLRIAGRVWKPVEVSPSIVSFSTCEDTVTNLTRTVRILNQMEQPLELSDLECTNRSFQVALQTIRAGKEFEVAITLVLPLKAGNVSTLVSLKTSSTNRPVINVPVVAAIVPELSAMPAKIQLPPELRDGMESAVILQNNAARPLALTKASANVAGVKVALKELQAGRRYSLVASFPAGFQVQRGQNVQLRIETDDPKTSAVVVPVYQSRHLTTMVNSADNDQLTREK